MLGFGLLATIIYYAKDLASKSWTKIFERFDKRNMRCYKILEANQMKPKSLS
jgi:hypothetical protein